MRINKNSWHFKLIKKMYDREIEREAENLCDYLSILCWCLVGLISMSLIALMGLFGTWVTSGVLVLFYLGEDRESVNKYSIIQVLSYGAIPFWLFVLVAFLVYRNRVRIKNNLCKPLIYEG